jgi:hypothetical protein
MKLIGAGLAALRLLGALASLPPFRSLPPSHADVTAPSPARASGAPGASAGSVFFRGGARLDRVAGAFSLVASDDEYGCDDTTLQLYTTLHPAGVPVEAHFLAQGKHPSTWWTARA